MNKNQKFDNMYQSAGIYNQNYDSMKTPEKKQSYTNKEGAHSVPHIPDDRSERFNLSVPSKFPPKDGILSPYRPISNAMFNTSISSFLLKT